MAMDPLNNEGALSRRTFLQSLGIAGVGIAGMACFGSASVARAESSSDRRKYPNPGKLPGMPGSNQDQAVLNYALTLEILEADLYRQCVNRVTGRPSDAQHTVESMNLKMQIEPGNLTDAAAATGFACLLQFAAVEAAHRDFLRSILQDQGGETVSPHPGGYQFPGGVGDTLEQVLRSILPVEELGVRAYLGATGLINDFGVLTAAGTIYSTECSHSSAIRVALGEFAGPEKMPGDQRAFPLMFSEAELEYYRDPKQVIKEIAPYLA